MKTVNKSLETYLETEKKITSCDLYELVLDNGNKYYYALADGQRAKGWVQLGDHWSYFYPESGEMARNTTVDTFYVDADGAWRH